MTEELRLVLTIIGVLAIGGILGHGLWSVRKNRNELQDYKKPPRSEPGLDTSVKSNEGLDDHGVGKPRTVGLTKKEKTNQEKVKQEPVINGNDNLAQAEVKPPVDETLPTQDKMQSESHNQEKPQVETQSVENPMVESPAVEPEDAPAAVEPSEVLILHVSMAEHQTIAGASLLPMLISMGFKFGEMDIFHRHQDSSGNGPVLFSLANMYNPGTFDIDNMEQMSTRGLSLFMTLPCHGDALQNFNMMHNGAKKVAEEFGAQILDSHRSVMTVQTVRHYVEKIREFERKQLING